MINEEELIHNLINADGLEFVIPLKNMTPEEVLKTVRTIIVEMKKDFIKLIKAQPKILFGVDLAKREHAWIPVAERLPEEDGEYITMTNAKGKSKGVMAQRYQTSMVRGQKLRRWYWNGRLSPWNTTHWMPMPEAPKEGEP